jgi:hypothetical protein
LLEFLRLEFQNQNKTLTLVFKSVSLVTRFGTWIKM